MADSVREQVLAAIQQVFATATASDSDGGTTWGRVLDSAPDGREKKGQNVMSVIEGNETYIDVISPDKRDRSLDIDLQTKAYIPMGTGLRTGANAVLADIEQIIETNADLHWGGLAYATFLQANSVDREDTGDRVVDISVFINVRYRTKRTNPRQRT